MKKVIIGIVSRPIHSNSNRNMLGVYETYIRSVIKGGGIPLIISPTKNMEYEIYNKNIELNKMELDNLNYVLKKCDGIIMPGGDSAYKYDYHILNYCIKNNIPILGICLGMQIMCSYEKFNLIPTHNHYLTNHKIKILKDSLLYKIFNKEVMYVNSRHKEQVKNSGIYKIVALCDDVIEAVELDKNTFNIGVEWHPEDLKDNQILFDKFIETIKKQK